MIAKWPIRPAMEALRHLGRLQRMEERIYESPAPNRDPEVSLTKHVIGGAAARGHPAIVDSATGETTSYASSRPGSTRSPRSLQGQGVCRGDVVALIGPNSAAWESSTTRSCARAEWSPRSIRSSPR